MTGEWGGCEGGVMGWESGGGVIMVGGVGYDGGAGRLREKSEEGGGRGWEREG